MKERTKEKTLIEVFEVAQFVLEQMEHLGSPYGEDNSYLYGMGAGIKLVAKIAGLESDDYGIPFKE